MSKCDNCIHVGVCHCIMYGGSDEIEECRHFEEARPRGEWIIDNKNEKFVCPICKHEIKITRLEYLPAVRWYLKPNFCEECGAELR